MAALVQARHVGAGPVAAVDVWRDCEWQGAAWFGGQVSAAPGWVWHGAARRVEAGRVLAVAGCEGMSRPV